MTTLASLSSGARAQVAAVTGGGAVRQRLLDMGLLPQTRIAIERVAPTGDPIWLRLDDYQLSLRRSEASMVVVAPIE